MIITIIVLVIISSIILAVVAIIVHHRQRHQHHRHHQNNHHHIRHNPNNHRYKNHTNNDNHHLHNHCHNHRHNHRHRHGGSRGYPLFHTSCPQAYPSAEIDSNLLSDGSLPEVTCSAQGRPRKGAWARLRLQELGKPPSPASVKAAQRLQQHHDSAVPFHAATLFQRVMATSRRRHCRDV